MKPARAKIVRQVVVAVDVSTVPVVNSAMTAAVAVVAADAAVAADGIFVVVDFLKFRILQRHRRAISGAFLHFLMLKRGLNGNVIFAIFWIWQRAILVAKSPSLPK